jgi:hypothetical protein
VITALDGFSGQLLTTSAVVTECMHLLSAHRDGPGLLAEMALAGGWHVADFTQPAALARAATLMTRYANVPMDFADATLVLLAEQQGVFDVLTLDRRGFSTYRARGKRALRLVLEEGGRAG